MTLVTTVKETKSHTSFMELARTKDGYLFDEVSILKIEFIPTGVEVKFEYTRHGNTLRDLEPVVLGPQDWAQTRAATSSKAAFANTELVKRLFASGARQFNERSKPAEEDFAADLEFLEKLGQDKLPS